MRAALGTEYADKILVAIVDGDLGPQIAAGGAFGVRTGGGKDPRPEMAGQLNGRGPDPRRSAVHQKPLASFQPAAAKDVAPDGEKSFGQAGGGPRIHTIRHRQGMGRGGCHVLGVTAPGQERANRITFGPFGHTGPDRCDAPCGLEPREVRCP